jgi:hypothetical protein
LRSINAFSRHSRNAAALSKRGIGDGGRADDILQFLEEKTWGLRRERYGRGDRQSDRNDIKVVN